jgi:hypothetical protein
MGNRGTGTEAWARLRPINTSSSASHVPRAGIANARRTRCQPRYATYRSEFLDPRWRGTRPPLAPSSIALEILRSAGQIQQRRASPRAAAFGDEVAKRHPLAQIESKSPRWTANGNSSEFAGDRTERVNACVKVSSDLEAT